MTTTQSIYRIIDAQGNKVSTAISWTSNNHFIQIKPNKHGFRTQWDWIQDITRNGRLYNGFTITREDLRVHKRWKDMTEEERQAHISHLKKMAVIRKNKRIAAERTKRQAESAFTKVVRSYYNQYNLPDSLQIKNLNNIKSHNPKLHILWDGDILPVYFNRKTGNVLIKNYESSSDVDPSTISAPYSFFVQRSHGLSTASLPKEDNRTPSPGQKTIGFTYWGNLVKSEREMISSIENKGFFVRLFPVHGLFSTTFEEIEINYPEIDLVVSVPMAHYTDDSVHIIKLKETDYMYGYFDRSRTSLSSWLSINY